MAQNQSVVAWELEDETGRRQYEGAGRKWGMVRLKHNFSFTRGTGHSKHLLPTTQEKTLHMDITRWSTPKSDWLYSLQPKVEKLSTQSTKTRPGADCGSAHELLITKFRLKLKKAGKTARPFRYDLNQIHYDYTVEVRNWFKGLDLIDRVPEEPWIDVHNIV